MAEGNQQEAVQPEPAPAGGGAGDSSERTAAMWCHLSALAAFLVPFGNLLGPLIVWTMKKDQMPLVDREGKKALNFQITLTLAGIALTLVSLPLMIVLIGIPLLIIGGLALGIFGLVMTIVAAIKTNNGEDFQYPASLTFLK